VRIWGIDCWPLVVGACETQAAHGRRFHPEYRGVETQIAGRGSCPVDVAMTKARSSRMLAEYANVCVGPIYFERGFWFCPPRAYKVEIEVVGLARDAVLHHLAEPPAG